MHRATLLDMLSNYKPDNELEKTYKAKMIDFIINNRLCFMRSLEIGHITGSAWLLNYDMSEYLLMHHKKLDGWFQPGGHADGESDILQVALKEAKEESGIDFIEPVNSEIFDIDIHLIPAYNNVPEHFHYDIRFLLKVSKPNLQPISNEESNQLRFFKITDTIPTKEESVCRMHRKWKKFYLEQL